MQKVIKRIYYWVHTTGFIADTVYTSAFYIYKIGFQFLYWKTFFRKVTLEEIRNIRQFDPNGLLITGITTVCNAKCNFCAYPRAVQNKTLKTSTMSMAIFTKAINEWRDIGGKSLCLTPVVGEPLIDPQISEKAIYAIQQAKMSDVWVVTNGILLNHNDNYKKLIDSGIHAIHISTQGTDKETYKQVYGVDCYEQVISGLHKLLCYNKYKGEPTRIYIRFRNAQKPSSIINSQDFKKYIKPYLSENVRINFSVDYDNWGGIIKEIDMIGVMKLRKQLKQVNLPCKMLFNSSVQPDGNIRLCGCRLSKTNLDDLIVGNINNDTIKNINENEKKWKIITGFYNGDRPETCKNCTMYKPINKKWLRQHAAH